MNTSSTENNFPQPGFRGHDVVDPNHRLIGTISDVVYGTSGEAQWAVVDLGLLRSSHYLPITSGYMAENGEFVVPYDKQIVKSAPRADRNHLVDASTRDELFRHYELK
jgi:ribosomal 30S subunit maturation factor RimM